MVLTYFIFVCVCELEVKDDCPTGHIDHKEN